MTPASERWGLFRDNLEYPEEAQEIGEAKKDKWCLLVNAGDYHKVLLVGPLHLFAPLRLANNSSDRRNKSSLSLALSLSLSLSRSVPLAQARHETYQRSDIVISQYHPTRRIHKDGVAMGELRGGTSKSLSEQMMSFRNKTDFSRLYTEVTFAIGSEFIRYTLDDSTPIANLQGYKKRIPYCQMWNNTGGTANEQTPEEFFSPKYGCPSEESSTHDRFCYPTSISGDLFGLLGTAGAERLACSPPTKANRVPSRPGQSQIFACGNRVGRCHWSAGFLGDLPFPQPLHSDATPYSSLKASLLRAAQIFSLFCLLATCLCEKTFSQSTGQSELVYYNIVNLRFVGRHSKRSTHCSPPTKAKRVQSPAVSLQIFASRNSAGRCRWSTGFLGHHPFPPHLYSGSAPFSPHLTLIGCQDIVVKSSPNLSTQLNERGYEIKGKIDFKRIYTEVTFAIGPEFIRHALDDSAPKANLQGNKKRIPYCQMCGKEDWLAPLIISCYVLITPLWVWIAKNHEHTREVLHSGWTPVMAAMLISRSDLLFTLFPLLTSPSPPRRTGFNPRNGDSGFSQLGIVPDLESPPPLHSGAAPFAPLFTLVGSQDIVLKSRLNLWTELNSTQLATLGFNRVRIVGSEQANHSATVAPKNLLITTLELRNVCVTERVKKPSQHSPGVISRKHGKPKSGWPFLDPTPSPEHSVQTQPEWPYTDEAYVYITYTRSRDRRTDGRLPDETDGCEHRLKMRQTDLAGCAQPFSVSQH
ncbi:hypothetical protein PR048_012367 [Dryococelus australis]|uniref:Uncharacterized protein n=1 Tax=Dryococelus australis TaxID=614101 RepID=A0ABQ9HP69_9NEOP|nr:hypothetical protein PR048_012367 [Dryococelus australis]